MPANGTNELNQSGPALAYNLSASNQTTSSNSTLTFICLNAVDNGNISYAWQNYSGVDPLNQTSWDNISSAANGSQGAPMFNLSLNATGENSTASINITGCNPVVAMNNTSAAAELSNCPFFAGNNKTTYVPHNGFYASNGSWVPENTSYWHPNQTGYLPSDSVFYATIEFVHTIPNVTYETVVDFAGATPIPQVFFLNTGTGNNNETVTFVFDTTVAWFSALPGTAFGTNDTNATNNSGGFLSNVFASINTFSITVSQCYIDASALVACPDTLGGTGWP
ncbi:MAG TPA: hypothetical protein VML94_03155 [Thermoplasmata archaeon]|nr:hypothetical protein [Thermoplasmata archaeon]